MKANTGINITFLWGHISFYPEDPFGLDQLAKENNVVAVMDCGVAPGMGNIIFSHHDKMMQITDYECLVGGLPIMPALNSSLLHTNSSVLDRKVGSARALEFPYEPKFPILKMYPL